MNRITTNVDQKLLRTTKFPAEFSQKVDTSKINIPVIKNWAAGEVSRILNYEDDIVIGLLFDLLEGNKHPDIKALQIQLTGFLGKDAAMFCKELWTLCLDAQQSETGIPKQLVEAKKLELLQEKIEAEKAAEEARRRRDEERARERELDNLRNRERRDRPYGRGGGGGGGRSRDYDRRPRDYSRSPPRRHRGPLSSRDTDSYVPGDRNGRRNDRRYRSRSPPPSRDPGSPSSKKRRLSSRSPSRSPERRYSGRRDDRRNESPPSRRRSPPPRRYRDVSRSPSRPPRRDRRRSRSTSRSDRRSYHRRSMSPRRRRRSPSSPEHVKDGRANAAKDPPARNGTHYDETRPARERVDARAGVSLRSDRTPDAPKDEVKAGPEAVETVSKSADVQDLPSVEGASKEEQMMGTDQRPTSTIRPHEVQTKPLTTTQLREKLLKQRLIARRKQK